jgi:hypothetical protein
MGAGPLDRPVFIGGTGSDGAASLALLLSEHPDLQACEPVRFGVISDAKGVVDAMLLGRSMLKASRTPWLDRLLAERQPAFNPEPMMGEERTPPEELVELLHRAFLPDPLLKPVGHRSDDLTAPIIEQASERYLATFWESPEASSLNLVHDLLRPTHGATPEHPHSRRWIDASRLGAVRAPNLLDLFPEASFVHIVRDGREVALRFMEISTGSAFPGAPVSSVPIDHDKEWNQAAFERGLVLWERRLISAASGLRKLPQDRALTVRVADLIGGSGPEAVRTILRRIGATEDEAVVSALPRYLSKQALREGRFDEVVPAQYRAAITTGYNAVLARLDDLGVPLP